MLDLFVLNAESDERVPVYVAAASERDLTLTKGWQTRWTTPFARQLPNKVALRRTDDQELLGHSVWWFGRMPQNDLLLRMGD